MECVQVLPSVVSSMENRIWWVEFSQTMLRTRTLSAGVATDPTKFVDSQFTPGTYQGEIFPPLSRERPSWKNPSHVDTVVPVRFMALIWKLRIPDWGTDQFFSVMVAV